MEQFIPIIALLNIWTVILSFAILIVFRLVHNKYHSKILAAVPGPAWAAYSSYWRAYRVSKGRFHTELINLHRQYGPLVRIAPGVVSVNDPAAVKLIYPQEHNFVKSEFYPLQSITWQKTPARNLFSTTSPAEHRQLARKVGPAYSLSNILSCEAALDPLLDGLTTQLQSRAGSALDLGAWIQYAAFDTIGVLTFGQPFGFLKTGTDVEGIIAAIGQQVGYAAVVGQIPGWHAWLLGSPLLGRLLPPLEDWNATVRFCKDAMRARAAGASDNARDMVSQWARVPAEAAHKMTERDMMVAVTANVFAGSDSIAIAAKSVMDSLCRHPLAMAKAVREIDAADAAGLLSQRVSYKEVTTHLPYLCAAIQEGQRLHPSFGLILERQVPVGGVVVAGQYLPAGTIAGISPWTLTHDAATFPDPDAFVPERWMQGSAEELRQREQVLAFNFGAGVRGCVGKNIALIDLHKIIAELLRRFEVRLAEPRAEMKSWNYWFVLQGELKCVLTARSNSQGMIGGHVMHNHML